MNPMELSNEIVHRPRFKMELDQNNEAALSAFEAAKKTQDDFIVTRLDDHVFIKIPKHKQHSWSPQLRLEIKHLEDNKSSIHGFFGPNPTIWTMFMFFHFIVGSLFIAFGIWAYTKFSLDGSYGLQLAGMFFMLLLWVALYVGGRIGKGAGKGEMHELFEFMKEVLQIK